VLALENLTEVNYVVRNLKALLSIREGWKTNSEAPVKTLNKKETAMKLVDRSRDAKEAPHVVEILTKVVHEFLAQLDYTKMAHEANTVAMRRRVADLRKAFSVYCASQTGSKPNVTIDNPLARYVYIMDVYKDAYNIMFEHLGEVEHMYGLDFSKESHPYNTSGAMWKEDLLLAHCEYIA